MDDAPLASSRHILLTATAPDRSHLLELRTLPVLVEPVRATIIVRGAGAITVHVLDHVGRRTARTVAVEKVGEGWRFQIGDERAFW